MLRQSAELLKTLQGLLENRLALFTLELQEERDFLLHLLFTGLTALILFCLFLAMSGVAILLFVDPLHRPWTAVGIALFYLLLAIIAIGRLRRSLRLKAPPFETTRHELQKDFE